MRLAVVLQPCCSVMRDLRCQSGFSLPDLIVVMAIIAVMSGIAVPTMLQATERMRLGQSTREVEREIQTAKQRAVSRGRPMRVRFNCPSAQQYRLVEVIGISSAPDPQDSSPNRCNPVFYPYPAADTMLETRPNLDGPVRRLDPSVTFTATQTLEFWPDGTVHYPAGGEGAASWPMVPTAGLSITLTRNSTISTITVNGLGRITLQ